MASRIVNTIIVLVFLIGSIATAANNKHFYNGEINDPFKSNTTINEDYELYQNFPNPFNPVTKISYKINKEGTVSLKVYNLVGQLVRVLVEEYQTQGTYETYFDANDLTAGVYLYKLQINDYVSVKRMTLIK